MPWYNGRLYVSAQEIASGAVPVESELNENSRYPIANQVVAKEIVKTNKAIEDTALGLGKLEKKKYLPKYKIRSVTGDAENFREAIQVLGVSSNPEESRMK